MTAAPFAHPVFSDYELIDSGRGEKLERFGGVTLRRPDPQALWRPTADEAAWSRADLTFVRESDRGGRWEPRPRSAPEARGRDPVWSCRYEQAVFRIRPTPFKHVGLFPEQAVNWDFVRAARRGLAQGDGQPRLLNLFGYTGAASVVGHQAGYAVCHVDASKTSIAWTLENAEASGLGANPFRVICDDALAFARREVRRGARYEAILLDPPHYGRGPKGEKWQFEEHLVPLLEALRALLAETGFVVLSTYAIGFTPLGLQNLLMELEGGQCDVRELALPHSSSARLLPAGWCARWWRGFEAPLA